MSGSTAKADRREVRRVIGDAAMALLDEIKHNQEGLTTIVGDLDKRLGLPDGKSAPVYLRLQYLEGAIIRAAEARRLAEARDQARDRTFWTRLRWLLTAKTSTPTTT
jgi:hypothetical protein